jgi:hypothetical protein
VSGGWPDDLALQLMQMVAVVTAASLGPKQIRLNWTGPHGTRMASGAVAMPANAHVL